jgi:hypothetical protein
MINNYMPTTTQGRYHNPGYEYLMGIYWMREAQVSLASEKTRYYLPAKALSRACLAIESYVNMVGSQVDPHWETIDEDATSIETRLARISNNLRQPLDLDGRTWKDVSLLFGLRDELSRFELSSIYGLPEVDVPEIFKEIEQKYSIRTMHGIAEEAIVILLNTSENSYPEI